MCTCIFFVSVIIVKDKPTQDTVVQEGMQFVVMAQVHEQAGVAAAAPAPAAEVSVFCLKLTVAVHVQICANAQSQTK